MLITPSSLNAVFQHFDSSFQAGLTGFPPSKLESVSSVFMSNTRENLYPIFAGLPSFRKWLGPRNVHNLRGHSYSLVNESYELTYGVAREDLEDATEGDVKLQFASMAFKQLGQQAAKLPETMLVELIESTSLLCYDQLTFFNDAHPENYGEPGSATFDNLYASTALTSANFDTVYAAMMLRKGADHKPLGIRPTHLVVPPGLRGKANEIIKAENIVKTAGDGSTTNTNRDLVEVVICPQLTSATTWYLLDCSQVVNPFIVQKRKSVELVSRTNLQDPNVFDNKEFVFGADLRMAVGYTLPQLASKCTA